MTKSFPERAAVLLDKAWSTALEATGAFLNSESLAVACDRVFAGTETGYQKAIVIQAAGKAADPALDAQAMQKGAGQKGSWDAREFAKQAYVPWNSRAGSPFAQAADPYVSNPYRIPRFDKSVRAQRKKPAEFDNALAVLEILNQARDVDDAFANLAEVLFALRRFVADRSIEYPLPSRASLSSTLICVEAFVAAKSGGARLQAVVYALFRSLRELGIDYTNLVSRHVNASDTSSRSAGDISFVMATAPFAIEVKDRRLSRAELEGTIEKCRISGVREVIFVVRAELPLGTDLNRTTFDNECARQFSSGLNIYVERFDDVTRSILTLVGENGRTHFLEAVGDALNEQNADVTHKWAWAALVKAI